MSQMPMVSVVIPTRDRTDVLPWSLRTVIEQDYPNLEILVSDNGDTDSARSIAERADCKRVRYVRPLRALCMTDHWNFAVEHASGDWVTILGDDDGLVRHAVSTMVGAAQMFGCPFVRTSQASYIWPSEPTGAGVLLVPPAGEPRLLDSKRVLEAVLAGRLGYQRLPVIYNGGLVDRETLKALRGDGGPYFRASSPDVYSGIALAAMVPQFVLVDEPLVVSGSSIHSTGRSMLGKRANQHLTGSPGHDFRTNGSLPLHSQIGMCRDGTYPPIMQAAVLDAYLRTSWCRHVEAQQVKEHLQLLLMSSEADWSDPVAIEWLHLFAIRHGWPAPGVGARLHPALLGRWLMRARALLKAAVSVRHLPPNVYEAAATVYAQRWTFSSFLSSTARRCARRFGASESPVG